MTEYRMNSSLSAYCRLCGRRSTLIICALLLVAILLTSKFLLLPSYDYNRQSDWYSSGTFIEHHFSTMAELDISSGSLPTDYNAVLLYLGSVRRSKEMILSLSYVFTNVPLHAWPILIFHAGEFHNSEVQKEFKYRLFDYIKTSDLRRAYMFVERIEFIQLEWSFPPGIPHDKEALDPLYEWAWPGYNHMIKFYLYDIFQHPRLKDVTYYMRMDTDSYIYSPVCYDPVERMHAHNLTYAYRVLSMEHKDYIQGLSDFIREYSGTHPDVQRMLQINDFQLAPIGEKTDLPQYYNNFEIVKIDAFRRPDVQEFLDEIMKKPERIYKWRWGDAPLRFATINMFFDKKKEAEEFCAIPYWHYGYHGTRCSCSVD